VGATLTATFGNENKVGTGIQLGSVNLTPPSGFTIDGNNLTLSGCAPGCTAFLDPAGVIELRNLNQAPGAPPITLTMNNVSNPASGCTVASPCIWSQEAKQSNNFSGTPGNDLNVDPNHSNLATVLGRLQFGTQPTGVQIGQHITGTPYNPGGPPVTVQVVDSTVPGALTSYNGSVTLTLNNQAVTLGGTNPEQASMGTATFADLTVNAGGYGFTLTASSSDNQVPPPNTASLPGATSQPFDAHQFASQVPCNGKVNCNNSVSDNSHQQSVNTSELTPNAGQLFVALDPASSFWTTTYAGACSINGLPYSFLGSDQASLNLTTATSTGKLIQTFITIPVPTVAAIKTITAGLQWCLAAPYSFTAKGGVGATPVAFLPDGITPGFVGLLDDCAIQPNQPCVSNRVGTKIKGSIPLLATFEIDVTIPASFSLIGDPWGRA
jgi:hypothetical protein